MDLVGTLPDVRYWSKILCCTILTPFSNLLIKVTDLEILCGQNAYIISVSNYRKHSYVKHK